MSAEAKNLEAIDKALEQHANECGDTVRAIEMNPFEVERLGWEDYKGIPIRDNEQLGTGMFKLICDGLVPDDDDEVTEAVAEEREVTV